MEGINNLGGTCAINSLIQIICRCEKLRNVILNANVPNESFTGELKEIIDLMYNQHKSLNPVKFINCFYNTFNGIFNRYEQIDINELWFYFYEKISEDTGTTIAVSKNIRNIQEEHDLKIAMFNNYKESELMKLAQGSFINIIQCCNCTCKSYSFEPFINITLDINNIEPNTSIAQLILNYMKEEQREKDDWKCDKCNNNHNYIKTCKIWKIPKILIVSLNRFKDINNKNNAEIIINNEIIFNNNEEYKFILQSIGLHSGNLLGGHYTALCNMKDGNYHLYNDDAIITYKEEVLKNNIKDSAAYLIVYGS